MSFYEEVPSPKVEWSEVDFSSSAVDPQQVRADGVQWNTLASVVGDDIVRLMTAYDRQSDATQLQLLDQKPEEYGKAFVTMFNQVKRKEVLRYIALLVDDMLQRNPEHIKLFVGLTQKHIDPFRPFLRLLETYDWFVMHKAAAIGSLLLMNGPRHVPDAHFRVMIEWTLSLISIVKLSDEAALVGMICFSRLVRSPAARQLCISLGGIDGLKQLLPRFVTTNVLITYNIIFSLWVLSYDAGAVKRFDDGLLKQLVDVLKIVAKEKVLRVTLACLRNVLTVGFNEKLFEFGFDKIMRLLSNRPWNDEDIEDDIAFISGQIAKELAALSTWDKYVKEVHSGELAPSPVHEDEAFWRENSVNFEKKDFEVIRVLVSLLKPESTDVTLCLAMNDIGEFANNHARGRQIVANLGGKERVMALLSHNTAKVQRAALMCMQRLFSSKWHVLAA